ncbi:MAG: DUF3021 domain-containing protein [Vagococcus sp.]|uniref:DUF3021 domain-containing protein n=1 Tax=Vagococcus sp. TaxID=1933889 RepID=UPI002FCA1E20
MRKVIGHILFGIPSGTFIGLLISVIISWQTGYGIYYPGPPAFMDSFANQIDALIAAIILWCVVGALFSVSSLIFEKLEWSILKQTVSHFIVTYLGLMALNILLNWFDYTIENVIQFTITFVVIYAIVWSVSMYRVKRSLDKINRQLNKKG